MVTAGLLAYDWDAPRPGGSAFSGILRFVVSRPMANAPAPVNHSNGCCAGITPASLLAWRQSSINFGGRTAIQYEIVRGL
jgi:hypothetical protein